MTEDASQSAKRRRRKASSRSRTPILKSPTLGRTILSCVAVAAVLAVAHSAQAMRLGANMYGILVPGMPEKEVRYLMGPPGGISADSRVWTYSAAAGGVTTVRFDDSGRIALIACKGTAGSLIGCPETASVGLGTAQDRLVNRLGPPTSEEYIPNGKVLHYRDLGLSFVMRQYRVEGIMKRSKTGRIGYLPRIAWHLLP